MKKLLVAIRADDIELIHAALANEFGLHVCHTRAGARAALCNSFDAVVCGVHFDDGNMFELLRYLRSACGPRRVPFFCVQVAGTALSSAIAKSIRFTTERMGADGFVDLGMAQPTPGAEHAFRILREHLHRLPGSG